jgi:hypothetical protein
MLYWEQISNFTSECTSSWELLWVAAGHCIASDVAKQLAVKWQSVLAVEQKAKVMLYFFFMWKQRVLVLTRTF